MNKYTISFYFPEVKGNDNTFSNEASACAVSTAVTRSWRGLKANQLKGKRGYNGTVQITVVKLPSESQ